MPKPFFLVSVLRISILLLVCNNAFSQKEESDSTKVYRNGLKISTYILQDIIQDSTTQYLIDNDMYYTQNFADTIVKPNEIIKSSDKLTLIRWRGKLDIKLKKQDFDQLITVNFENKRRQYKIKLKDQYKFVMCNAKLPTASYPFITLYFKTIKIMSHKTRVDYISIRLPLNKKDKYVFLVGYV